MNPQSQTDKLMLVKDHLYGLTLNGDEQFEKVKSFQRFPMVLSHCLKQILMMQNVFDYVELYPEFSPSKNTIHKNQVPRLHFHGCCYVKPREFYSYGWKTIDIHYSYSFNQNTNHEYCTKNKHIMESWCKDYELPYKITFDSIAQNQLQILKWCKRAREL